MENPNGGKTQKEKERNENKNEDNDNENEVIDMKEMIKNWDKEYLAIEKITSSKDSTTCTYDGSYQHQEVFACLTCFNDTKKYGALCVGCSLSCHRGHEIISLYFKRNIKCDCGNSSFLNECKLQKEKDYENNLNEYSHNYEGKYCNCNEEEDDNEMIQCFLCEEWYHKRHLNIKGDLNEYDEGDLICNKCFRMPCFNFILDYSFDDLIILPFVDTNTPTSHLHLTHNPESTTTPSPRKAKRTLDEAFGNGSNSNINTINPLQETECYRSRLNNQIKRNNKIVYDMIIEEKYDVLLSVKALENKICHCVECTVIYSKNKLPFVTNNFYVEWVKRIPFESRINNEINEDTDENNQILANNNLNKLMNSKLNELDVEKQVELSMINKEFYDQFKQYLLSIKPTDDKEIVVTYEHVKDFLEKFSKILHK